MFNIEGGSLLIASTRSYHKIWATMATKTILLQEYNISVTYIGAGESMIEYPIGYSIVVPKGHDKKHVFLIIDKTGKPVADAIWDNTHNAFVLTINNGQMAG